MTLFLDQVILVAFYILTSYIKQNCFFSSKTCESPKQPHFNQSHLDEKTRVHIAEMKLVAEMPSKL